MRISDMVDELKNWRGIGSRERALLLHLLRGELQGKAEILEQMKSVEVMRISLEVSLRLRSGGPLAEVKDSVSPSPRANDHIPVEGFHDDEVAGSTSVFRMASLVPLALHVTGGKISELEIYKEDGSPILTDPYEIDLSRVHFY